VWALLDNVVHEPVLHLGRSRLAQQKIQLIAPEILGATDQQGQQSRSGVPGRPELPGELLLSLQSFGHRTQCAEVHAVVVAVSRVHRS
jgi:hypothetical protein